MISEMYEKQTVFSAGGVYQLNNEKTPRSFSGQETAPMADRLSDSVGYEVVHLLPNLNNKAVQVIQALHEKYGELLYTKIIQSAKHSASSGVDQLERELLSGRFEQMLASENESWLQNQNLSEEFGETVNLLNDDLDYLDALASRDFRRLGKFSSGRESLSAIFSEIVENEHQHTSNFQDAVFEKNIQFIFNSDVDLDDVHWTDSCCVHPACGLSDPQSTAHGLEKTLREESFFLKQLRFFSFYLPNPTKEGHKELGKPVAYYTTFWMGISVAALAFAWFLIR